MLHRRTCVNTPADATPRMCEQISEVRVLRRDRETSNKGSASGLGDDDEAFRQESRRVSSLERHQSLLSVQARPLDEGDFLTALEQALNRDVAGVFGESAKDTAIQRARPCLPRAKQECAAIAGYWGPEQGEICRFILEAKILPDNQLGRRCHALFFHSVEGRAATSAEAVLRALARGEHPPVHNILLSMWVLDVLVATCWRNSIELLQAFAPNATQETYVRRGWRVLRPNESVYIDLRDSESMRAQFDRMKQIYFGLGAADLWESIPE